MAYVVKKGDNLTKIAKQNGLSLNKLLELNKQIKNPDLIQVGQKINLPSSSPTGKQLYDNNDGYPTTPVKKSSNTTKPIWDKTTKGAAKIDTSANFNKTPTKTVVQKKPQSKNVKNEDVSFLQDIENDIEKYSQTAKTFITRKILPNIPGYDIGENEKTSKINLEKPTNPKNFEFIKGNKIYDQEFGKNVYHSSRYIDLNNPSIKTNVHNRGQKYDKPIPFKEILFSNFDNNVFDDINYLKRTKKLKNDSFYMGTDVNGKLIMGYGKDIQNINGVASPFTVIKNVKGFSKNKDQFKLQKSKFANKAKDPFLLDDQNNEIPINILTSEVQDGHKKYGQYYGGSFILLSPDMKKKVLVSGSLDELDKSMEKFKKDNNFEKINVVKVDNGSYSRQFAVDQANQVDQQFWNKYEGLNNSGGNAVYMYNNGGYVASDNIDIDYYTNPIKYFAAKGANIPTSWDNYKTKLNSKEESKFLKWRSTLPENLQNENDYDLRGYYKEYGNKPIPKGIEPHLTDEFKLPNHPTFSQNSRYYNDETSYLGGKWENGSLNWIYVPNSNLKNRLFGQKSMDEVRSDFLNQNHNMLSRSPNMFKKFGGYAEMGFDTNDYYSAIANERPRDSATSYQQDVKGKFNWLNTLAKTPIEQIQKDIDSIPLTKNYMLNKTPKGYSGAALMYPMEYGGNVIQHSQSESTQLIKNQKYIVDDANNYRLNLLEQTSEDFMKGWVTSPMYKKMFDKSKQKGEEPIPESWITNTKWGRKPILTKEGVAGNYNSRTDSLYIKNNILTSKNQAYATGVHEISHSSDNGGDIIPLNDVKKMKDYAKIDREKYYGELPWYKKILYDKTELNNFVKEDLDFKKYVAEPTETRARLNVIRALGKKQGVYDPYISPINSQQLNEIKFEDDGYNPIDQLKLIYSDEEIIDMLNSISKNNDKKIIRGKFGTTAETIYSMNEQPKVILTPDDIKAESGFNFQKYFPMERDIPVDTATSYNRDVDKFAWKNTLQGDYNLKQLQSQQQLPQQIDSSYFVQKTPKGYLNVYDKSNKLIGYSMDNKTIVKQEPNFEDGGMIQAWIQKFAMGGSTNPYITPYTNFPQEENPIQGFNNQTNNQMQVPVVQSNVQPYSTPYQTNYNASNDQVNKDNKQADSMMGGNKMSKMNPADAVLGGVNAVGDVATGALTAFAKPGSKAAAYAQGSAKAQSVVKPLEKIPIIGQASKLISGIIGGALEARRKGIENEETDKQNNQLEYLTRNTQSVNQPSYYGQYMAKYGANPKMMEQRVIDDIYSDFDKYMKLT